MAPRTLGQEIVLRGERCTECFPGIHQPMLMVGQGWFHFFMSDLSFLCWWAHAVRVECIFLTKAVHKCSLQHDIKLCRSIARYVFCWQWLARARFSGGYVYAAVGG